MINNYSILDLETTGKETFKRFANPLDSQNKIVLAGWKLGGEDPQTEHRFNTENNNRAINLPFSLCNHIIGHNLKFDLLYLWGTPRFQRWLKEGGKVVDTMTLEYLLTGQYARYASLDALSEQYGGTLKDSRVKDAFEAGISADEMDPDMLKDYLIGDLENTETIFLNQIEQAKQEKMVPIVKVYMEHYLALCEMEYNGLYVHKEKAMDMRSDYEKRLEDVLQRLQTLVQGYWTLPMEFNPDHLDHVSAVLFNTGVVYGVIDEIKDENGEVVTYKTGKRAGEIKTRKGKRCDLNEGFGIPTRYSSQTRLNRVNINTLNAVFASGEAILNEIMVAFPETKEFISALLEYRETNKFLSTYLYGKSYNAAGTTYKETGLIPLISPTTGCIHPTFDCVQTATGRLNSSNPNAQNIPKEVTSLMTSRYGEEGQIVVLDYSQLEVCIQAYLTQSTNLIQDIKDGIDFHVKRLAYSVDKPYEEVVGLVATFDEWKEKRRAAKTVSFQKAYGAQPEKISISTGLDVEVVKKIFAKEDAEYPEIQQFYDTIMKTIQFSAQPVTKLLQIRDKANNQVIEREGENQLIGYYQSVTGKKYHFKQKAVLTKRGDVFSYFPPTEVFNYPIQGTAADVVSAQVGKVFRYLLKHRDKALMINEVHDSLILDVRKEFLTQIVHDVKLILENVPRTFEELLKLDFNVPISVDVKTGVSWGEAS